MVRAHCAGLPAGKEGGDATVPTSPTLGESQRATGLEGAGEGPRKRGGATVISVPQIGSWQPKLPSSQPPPSGPARWGRLSPRAARPRPGSFSPGSSRSGVGPAEREQARSRSRGGRPPLPCSPGARLPACGRGRCHARAYVCVRAEPVPFPPLCAGFLAGRCRAGVGLGSTDREGGGEGERLNQIVMPQRPQQHNF
ncbi:unnamed protein product [Natator depressus]